MPKYPEEPRNVSVPPPGSWVWDDEALTVEFVRSCPAEEGVLRKRKQSDAHFNELHRRAEWLADTCTLNHRGRQSTRKSLSPAHLDAYRSSVMRRQGEHITIDDVKQVAVSLLQENYSLPIPFCFLAVLKSKELDEVLTALLLYLSCFFEHKSLENKPKPAMAVDIISEQQVLAQAVAKKELAQKRLAMCYFSLIMDLEVERHQHTSHRKVQMSSNSTEWLLHASLYSFFCFVAWVTFGRKDLRDIQEEVGRLLYSDTFNTAMRNRTDGRSGRTFAPVNGSLKTEEADPEETGRISTFRHRPSQRHPALSSVVNQRSPLMVSLLPSPKERSPHLFLAGRARRQSPPRAPLRDTAALMEELHQQLASVSFGILGKPLRQFNRGTLIAHGEHNAARRDEDDDHEPGSDVNNNSEGHAGVHLRGSRTSFAGPKPAGLSRIGTAAHTNARPSAAAAEAVASD